MEKIDYKGKDDTLQASNLEWKQAASACNNRIRQHYFNKLDGVN